MRCTPGKIKSEFKGFKGYIVDIEGVLIRGEISIPFAVDTINTLIELKKKLIFLSNISNLTREEVFEKLLKIGFRIKPAQILTSSFATVLFLKNLYPDKKRVLLIGSDSFKKELTSSGFEVVKNFKHAHAVVIGLDFHLNYKKICEAAKAVRNGSLFIAANIGKIKLTNEGNVIGPGFTVKGLEYITGEKALLVGKPGEFIFKLALEKLRLSPSKVLTIGDKLEQDIKGGKTVGTATCLVLSGATGARDIEIYENGSMVDYILKDICELLASNS
jgi:HAD superfamily hydrolase (TIGR01450 family)